MNVQTTTNMITAETLTYAPAVLAGVQAMEAMAPTAANPIKQSAVVQAVTGIEVVSGALEASPNPTVASVAILVNLFCALIKAFRHQSSATPPSPAPAAPFVRLVPPAPAGA